MADIVASSKERFVGITFPNLLQNYGMVWTSAHVSSIIQASGPVFTIVLALIFLKEHLGLYKIAGTALAITGTLLLITEGGVTFSARNPLKSTNH